MATNNDMFRHSISAYLQRSETAKGSALVQLPGEIIDKILKYLPQQHLLQLMFTCTRLAYRAQPVLYRHLDLFIPNGIDMLPQLPRYLSYDRTSLRETQTMTIRNASAKRAEDTSSKEFHTAKAALGEDDEFPFDVSDAASIAEYLLSNRMHGVTALNVMVYHLLKHLTPGRLQSFSFEHTLPLGYRVMAHLATHQKEIQRLHVTDIFLAKLLVPRIDGPALASQIQFWLNREGKVPPSGGYLLCLEQGNLGGSSMLVIIMH